MTDPNMEFERKARERMAAQKAEPEGPKNNMGLGTMEVHTIPLRCTCGREWDGPTFTPLLEGEVRRLRTCDTCLDTAEAASLAKVARNAPRSPVAPRGTAAPLRLPWKDD